MKPFSSEGLSDDEVVDKLLGREVEFVMELSNRESSVIVRSDAKISPEIEHNHRGRTMKFISPEGYRWVQVENILRIGRKKY